jgi:molecular chaperone DnaJ
MATTKRDYYEVLGIARTADKDEIKKAFRRLARQYHPDVNKQPDAEGRFKEVNEAYEVLSDDQRRALYDRYGHAAANGQAGGNPFEGMGDFPFGDIMETFFGAGAGTRGGGRTRAQRGADRRTTLVLEFREAIFGGDRELEIERQEVCGHCQGQRSEPGTSTQICPTCQGRGEIRRQQQTILGQFVTMATCDRCGGEGRIITTPCGVCRGEGRTRVRRSIRVTVPAGVYDGATLRLSGEADAGLFGGPAGHLYVELRVKPDPVFVRNDDDLVVELPINIAQAALGAEIEAPTLEGPITLRVPEGTQNGKVFRLREKGVPHLRGMGRGDLVVNVVVTTPTNLTAEQRLLLEQLGRSFAPVAKPAAAGAPDKAAAEKGEKGFFDKLKDTLGLE